MFEHKRLDVYKVAREFVVLADRTAHSLPPGRAYLSDQLRRAASSILLNIAEGCGEFSAKDKARFYRMAKRSVSECSGLIDILSDGELANRADLELADQLLSRTTAMLVGMIHAVQKPHA